MQEDVFQRQLIEAVCVWECNQMAVLEACRAVTSTHQELDKPLIGVSEFMPLRARVHTLTGRRSM